MLRSVVPAFDPSRRPVSPCARSRTRTIASKPAVGHALCLAALSVASLISVACRGGTAEAPEPAASESDFMSESALERNKPQPAEALDSEAAPTAEPVPVARPPNTIFRSEVVRVTNFGPAYLLRELGPEPFRHAGRFVGWEITQVFPDDPELCAPGCDLKVGDVVLSVNGSRLETPQQLSDEFGKLPERSKLTVVSLRNEKRRSVTYTIVEDLR